MTTSSTEYSTLIEWMSNSKPEKPFFLSPRNKPFNLSHNLSQLHGFGSILRRKLDSGCEPKGWKEVGNKFQHPVALTVSLISSLLCFYKADPTGASPLTTAVAACHRKRGDLQ